LLGGLLISNSILAVKPDPKKKLIVQQLENFIFDCNIEIFIFIVWIASALFCELVANENIHSNAA